MLNIYTRSDVDISQAMKATMQKVNQLIDNNASTVKNSVQNIEAFKAMLNSNADRLDRISATGESMMRAAHSDRN